MSQDKDAMAAKVEGIVQKVDPNGMIKDYCSGLKPGYTGSGGLIQKEGYDMSYDRNVYSGVTDNLAERIVTATYYLGRLLPDWTEVEIAGALLTSLKAIDENDFDQIAHTLGEIYSYEF